jgi:branched-chain amino acid transport system ATP-binding protein
VSLLVIKDLEVRHSGITALQGVCIEVAASTAVAVIGANGAGKTTLMQAIIGWRRLHRGTISFDGNPLDLLRPDRRAHLGIGYCPQGRRVFAGLTVDENLAVACWSDRRERQRRIERALVMFPELAAHRKRRAWQLSGGQQQMLAIGRALMNAPRLLLLDEPSLGLSPRLVETVFGRIPDIVAEGTTVVVTEQNAAAALAVCSEAYVLALGRVIRTGGAAEVGASEEVRSALLGG